LEKTVENHIIRYFDNKDVLSKEDLMELLKNDFPTWSNNTINTYLYKLKKNGVIDNVSRGIYTVGKIQLFTPKLTMN
jgi:predicted transcriptional regulator